MKKRIFSTAQSFLKIGLFKTIFIFFASLGASAEYDFEWKGRQVHIRKHTSDYNVFRQIFVMGQYRINVLDDLKIDTIVDLGANIGLSVLDFKVRFPQARVIAVEPEQGNYKMLVKNVGAMNGVYCLNNAIWNSSRSLGLHDKGLGEYGFVTNEQSDKTLGSVRSLTIDNIMEQFNLQKIDVLKIDIEGSEKELFTANYESWLPHVGCIIIELHDWMRPGCAAAFFKAISAYPYNVSFKGENITVVFDGRDNFRRPPTLSRKAILYNKA